MSTGVEGAPGFQSPIGNGAEPFFGTAAEFDLSIQQVRAGQGVHYAFYDAPSTTTPGKVMPDTPPGNAGPGQPSRLQGLQRLGPLVGIGAAGYALGDRVGEWYHGQEVAIARRIGDRVGGQVSTFSEQAYVIGTHLGFPSIGGQAQIDYANGLLSLKAGRPTDFRTMEPNALADLIEAPWPNAAQLREHSARLKAQAGPRATGDDPDPATNPDAKPDQPAGPNEPQQGFIFETRNDEEAALVATLRAQGKPPNEIQLALDNLRAGTAPASQATQPFSGRLIQTSNHDPHADALAQRLGGQARVRFENDPDGREFDAVSERYVAQTESGGEQNPGIRARNQMKATFEAALATNRIPYFEFRNEPPSQRMLDHIARYEARYGIRAVIVRP